MVTSYVVRRIDVSNGLRAVQSSLVGPIGAVVFLSLAVLNVAAALFGNSVGVRSRGNDVPSLIVMVVCCAAVGVFWGRAPFRRTTTVEPGATELVFRSRALFGGVAERVDLQDVTGVRVDVGVYWEWVTLVQREGPPLRLLARMKTWTFKRNASDATKDEARRIAEYLKVPLA